MISVDVFVLWSDDEELIVKALDEATQNIINYKNSDNRTRELFYDLNKDITSVCNFWTGKTYIGNQKTEKIERGFQKFFTELMNLLRIMKNSKYKFESRFADKMLYRGKVYRFLGNDHPSEKVIIPRFNDIYVSWSKMSENRTVTEKLYGTKTWLACDIITPEYGIDLDGIDCSRAEEHEVVFPTFEEYITEIKYIPEENNE